MIRRHAGSALWFVVAFAIALLWLFPVEPLVQARLAELEARSGISVRWESASWALWRSVLRGVTVSSADGRVLMQLDQLAIRPGFGSIFLGGSAAWGTVSATVAETSATFSVQGLPVDLQDEKLPEVRLSADGRWDARPPRVEVSAFSVTGRAKLPAYEGPMTASGKGEFKGIFGKVDIESLEGDNLRGRGFLDIKLPSQAGETLRVLGRFQTELAGNTFNMRLQVQAGEWTVSLEPSNLRGQ